MKRIILLLLLVPLCVSAQNDSTENKKFIRVISVSAFGGGEFYREGFEDRTVFQQAAPNSSLAYADLSGYATWSGFAFRNVNANTCNGLNVNLRMRGMPGFSEFRVGIGHTITSYAYQSYSQESRTFMGTTTLPGGEILSTDSVSNAYYSYAWDADILQLNLAWIVRSNPGKWMNVYTGLGAMAGIGYNGVLEYNHYHTSEYEHTGGTGNIHYTTNRTVITEVNERYRAPMFGAYTFYIPMGFNLRLGKRNNFFKHFAVFGEYTGALQILSPKGMNTKVRTASGAYGGIRYYMRAPGSGWRRKRSPDDKRRDYKY